MLIALFTLLLISSSSDGTPLSIGFLDDTRAAVELALKDEDNLAPVLALLDVMQSRVESQDSLVEKSIAELDLLIRDRLDNNEKISVLAQRQRAYAETYSRDILDLRYELKSQISRENWNRIFSE